MCGADHQSSEGKTDKVNPSSNNSRTKASVPNGTPNNAPIIAKPIPDIVINSDVPFDFNLRSVGTVMFGYDAGGRGLVAKDNYFAASVRFFQEWKKVTFENNTVVSRDAARVVHFDHVPGESIFEHYHWDGSEYFTNSATPFLIGKSQHSWDSWREQTELDSQGSFKTVPRKNHIAVRPNRYEEGRGHVIVCNWKQLGSVDVDLSEVVSVGTEFEVLNVLDLQQPVLFGTYVGGTVELPMVEVTSPTAIGHLPPAPLKVSEEFATFLVRSKVALPSALGGQLNGKANTPNQYFVSPSGSSSNDGSQKYPWDLKSVLTRPDVVRPGDTVWLLEGTYNGCFTSKLHGTAEHPIHVRAFPGAKVALDLYAGKPGESRLLTFGGQYTHYRGLEILSSDPTSRTSANPGSWPTDIARGNFNVTGDHIKVINCVIHDINNGIGYFSAGEGGEVYGSLIYNNGWVGPDRNHGHAIYSQNDGATRIFSENVVFNQFRNGIKIYGSDAATLNNYDLKGNVSFNNGGAEGEGFTGTFQYLIGGGSVSENILLQENYCYVGKSYFLDTDADEVLTYSATLTNGQALPDWLTFHSTEAYFVGSPTINDVGTIEIEVTAQDAAGVSVSDVFQITVRDLNNGPAVVSASSSAEDRL
jgi:hypothetical protein